MLKNEKFPEFKWIEDEGFFSRMNKWMMVVYIGFNVIFVPMAIGTTIISIAILYSFFVNGLSTSTLCFIIPTLMIIILVVAINVHMKPLFKEVKLRKQEGTEFYLYPNCQSVYGHEVWKAITHSIEKSGTEYSLHIIDLDPLTSLRHKIDIRLKDTNIRISIFTSRLHRHYKPGQIIGISKMQYSSNDNDMQLSELKENIHKILIQLNESNPFCHNCSGNLHSVCYGGSSSNFSKPYFHENFMKALYKIRLVDNQDVLDDLVQLKSITNDDYSRKPSLREGN